MPSYWSLRTTPWGRRSTYYSHFQNDEIETRVKWLPPVPRVGKTVTRRAKEPGHPMAHPSHHVLSHNLAKCCHLNQWMSEGASEQKERQDRNFSSTMTKEYQNFLRFSGQGKQGKCLLSQGLIVGIGWEKECEIFLQIVEYSTDDFLLDAQKTITFFSHCSLPSVPATSGTTQAYQTGKRGTRSTLSNLRGLRHRQIPKSRLRNATHQDSHVSTPCGH